jgi:outer membrane protein TolC
VGQEPLLKPGLAPRARSGRQQIGRRGLASVIGATLVSAGALAQSPGTAPSQPPLPAISDPLLDGIEPAKIVITTWQEAWARARSKSTALQGARARVTRARGERSAAWGRALPTLTATGNAIDHLVRSEGPAVGAVQPVTLPLPTAYWTGALELRVPLLAAQSWLDLGASGDSLDGAVNEQRDAERLEVARLALAIVNAVTTEQLAEVTRVSLTAALASRELTERRAALGGSGKVDVLRVQQEAVIARAQVVSADDAVRRAREALGDVLGTSEPVSVSRRLRVDGLLAEVSRGCASQAGVAQRSDVVASSVAANAARRRADAAGYALVPTLQGVSSATYYSDPLASPNREHSTWSIGAVLTWRILDGGTRVLDAATREADWSVAEQKVRDVTRRARIELAQAVRGVELAESNLESARKTRELAVETARLIKISYAEGGGTSLDLVDATRRLREAELDLALKEFDAVRARIAAFLASARCVP